MTTTVTVRPLRDARPVLLFFICVTIAALIGQTWWAIVQDRQLTIEAEKQNGLITVRGLAEHAVRMLEQVEHVVANATEAIHGLDDAALADQQSMHRILAKEKIELPSVAALWSVNLQGMNWVTSMQYPAREFDFSKHQFIQLLNAQPDYKKAAIGLPMQSGYDNEWVIPIARNLYDRNGRRIGIIGASIRVAYFLDFYARVTGVRNATITLRTNDGFVLIRTPFDERTLGRDISRSPAFQKARNGRPEDSFEDISIFDGHRRLFTYSKAANFPITTTYALNIDSALAPWKSRSVQRILFSGATILLIGVLTFFLFLHIRRLRRTEDNLAVSENRYRMLYEGATDAILVLDQDQVYVDCNSAAVTLFGVQNKNQIIGRSAGDFSPSEQPNTPSSRADRQRLIDAALAGEPQQFEWAIVRNGELHFSEITLSRASVNNKPLALCIFRDIGARKQSEELQKGQNQILHIIAAGADLQRILNEIILFIEKRAPHSRCMMLLLNEDQSRFTWGAGPNIAEELMLGMSNMQIKEGNGASSEAVLTQYPVMVEDIASNPSMRAIRDLFTESGFVSCGCWPIMGKRGQILGAFSMLYGTRGIPSAQDVQLVGISTDLAGIAIESRRAEDRIRHLAHYDELTGLPNRFLYIQYLNKALVQAERSQAPIGVLFLDLDRFKNINDTFGHETGDAVLRNVSTYFRACLRDSDTIARVGGDEFIVLVENYTDPRHLGEIAQRLLIEAARPFEIDGQECQLSASIGIATYPVDGESAQLLLKNADIAMYRAKATGRNNYQFYSAAMNTHSIERMALETRLRRAIERREFVVYYQPKLDVRTGQIVGAEALVRWQHPEQGLLFPGAFIGLAEETGLIGALGMLVLDIACCGINAFNQAGISFGRVAINLSGSQLNDANLPHDVKNVIDTRQVDPACLEFEITESMVMNNREQAIELMDDIRALGFTLSIDDFGTGYSSLAYLKRFPVDSVKIDKSFIDDIPQDPNDFAIVQAIIVMAHTLGLRVIAEGVETITQLETLQKFNCDEYQGFYFSKAIPEDEFIALVRQQALIPWS
jgi:diguanylate cyclase (GGDEF)-like protein/PAS domain S-box-containing protein